MERYSWRRRSTFGLIADLWLLPKRKSKLSCELKLLKTFDRVDNPQLLATRHPLANDWDKGRTAFRFNKPSVQPSMTGDPRYHTFACLSARAPKKRSGWNRVAQSKKIADESLTPFPVAFSSPCELIEVLQACCARWCFFVIWRPRIASDLSRLLRSGWLHCWHETRFCLGFTKGDSGCVVDEFGDVLLYVTVKVKGRLKIAFLFHIIVPGQGK